MEINASYIKGMLNNLDIQLVTAMNRWIVGIKLFHFELIHVLGTLHTGLDGLSCHAPSPNDPIVEDNTDDWLDRTMGFAVILMNTTAPWTGQLGLLHHLDNQVCHLGWFTTWNLLCPAYHQTGDNYDLLPIEIPCSQEAQHTDKWLKLAWVILMDSLAPVDLTEAKL